MENKDVLLHRLCEDANEWQSSVRLLPFDKIFFQHRFHVNSGFCCAMFDYLPYSSEIVPDIEQRNVRDAILDFKKGVDPRIFADLMAAAAAGERMLFLEPETVLFCIPAATIEKHEKRFKAFSRALAENLGIIDGFPMLRVIADREQNGKKILPLKDSVRLDDPEGMLKDRPVTIVDDVYTKGGSFISMSELLTAAGAKSVTGLFFACSIGRTE